MEKIKQGRGIVGMREGEICNFNSLWSENASLRKGHVSKDLKGVREQNMQKSGRRVFQARDSKCKDSKVRKAFSVQEIGTGNTS